MKTIRELRNEGLISTRLYNALIRGITFDDKFTVRGTYRWEIDRPNGNDLTPKDVIELWSKEEICRWRGMGQSTFEELKGLI